MPDVREPDPFDEFFAEEQATAKEPAPKPPPKPESVERRERRRKHKQMPGKTLANKIRWEGLDPKTLGKEERRQVVLFLESRGMSKGKIAEIAGISYDTVVNDLRALGDDLIRANAFDLSAILGWVFRTADETAAQARRIALKAEKQGEYGKAASGLWRCWRTVKEYVGTLQSMGVLEKAPDKTVVHVEVRAQVQQIFQAVVQVVNAEVGDSDVREKIQIAVTERLGELMGGSLPGGGADGQPDD